MPSIRDLKGVKNKLCKMFVDRISQAKETGAKA